MFHRIRTPIKLFANGFSSPKYQSFILRNKGVRFYLSPAYNCDEKWKNRMEDPFIKNIIPNTFYYDLIKKFKTDGKVSFIDADIFLNSLSEENFENLMDEMEEVIRLLRRSPETLKTLPSSIHAVVRTLLKHKKYDTLLKYLSDPMNYGIFLDFYSANLIMNTFLEEKNYMAAARVASHLMLQEDYGPPLTKAMVLLSCMEYIFNPEENEPWVDFNPIIEPEEEVLQREEKRKTSSTLSSFYRRRHLLNIINVTVKIVVKYIRNPSFDDHFDLKNPVHIVGKTIAWLSFHLQEPSLKMNAQLLGWALFEKWENLRGSLEKATKEKIPIHKDVLSKITDQIQSCEKDQIKSDLSSLLSKMSSMNLASDESLMDVAKKEIVECVKKFEESSLHEQESTYDKWIGMRKEAVQQQLEMYERNRLMKEIEAKKEDLQNREDVIFFFENKDKIDLLIAKKKRYYPKDRSLIYGKKKPKVVDVEYIPPDV